MGLPQFVKAGYANKYRPDALRQLVLPAGAPVTATAGAAGSTYGAWVDVEVLANILVDTLVVGVGVHNPSATDEFHIDIGSCIGYANAAGVNAVPAAVIAAHRQEIAYDYHEVTAVGVLACGMIPLFAPIWIPAGVGILARIYGITAVAVTLDINVACLQNFA